MSRIRKNFASGTLTAALTPTGTTLTSPELTTFPAVIAPDIASISIDPEGDFGTPEIIYITAHAAGSPTATIVRGQEGSVARSHSIAEPWINALTTVDLEGYVRADGTTFSGSLVLQSGSTSSVPLTLAGIAGQTANLLEIESSLGTVVARVTGAGDIYGASVYDNGNRVYSASNPVPDNALYAHLSGTETFTGAKTFSGTAFFTGATTRIGTTTTGTLTIGDGTITKTSGSPFVLNQGINAWNAVLSEMDINSNAVGTIPLQVTAFAGQTANLTEWRNSVPTVVSYVNSSGQIFDNGNRVYNSGFANLASTTPSAETFASAGAVGTGTTYARADHVHPMPATPVTSIVAGTAITVSGATGAVTVTNAGYHSGNANLASTVASSLTFAQAAAVGVGTTYARADHVHGTPPTPVTSIVAGTGISISGATGAVTINSTTGVSPATTVTSETTYGIAAAVGVGTLYARNDHTHGTPPTPVTSIIAGTGVTISGSTGAVTINASATGSTTPATTVVSGTSFGLAAAVGVATTTFAREDHSHGTPPTPVTSIVAGTGITISGATGAVTINSTGGVSPATTVVASTAFGQASAVGTGTLYARNDHVHGTPATPVTSAVAGTGIGVSGATGAVTFTNTGATSVAGRTGAVTLTAADIAAGSFPAGAFTFTSSAIAAIPLAVKGFAGQTGNLTEWRDSSNAILARVASNGTIWVGATQLGAGAGNATDTETMAIMGGF